MNNVDKDQDPGVRVAAHLVGPDMEAPVEWKELRDGQVGKVGPGHLNHLEGGGGVYEVSCVCCAESRHK